MEAPVSTQIKNLIAVVETLPMEVNEEFGQAIDCFKNVVNEAAEKPWGVVAVKFAEAGLFLQVSAGTYAKRVDDLFDSTLKFQLQLCSHTEDQQAKNEAEKIKERLVKKRVPRKKPPVEETDVEFIGESGSISVKSEYDSDVEIIDFPARLDVRNQCLTNTVVVNISQLSPAVLNMLNSNDSISLYKFGLSHFDYSDSDPDPGYSSSVVSRLRSETPLSSLRRSNDDSGIFSLHQPTDENTNSHIFPGDIIAEEDEEQAQGVPEENTRFNFEPMFVPMFISTPKTKVVKTSQKRLKFLEPSTKTKPPRAKQASRFQLRPVLEVGAKTFERFYCQNYEASNDEGEVLPANDSSEEEGEASYHSDSESSDVTDFCASILTEIIDNATTDEVEVIATPPVTPATVLNEDINNNKSHYLPDFESRNMTEWRRFIEPKLEDAVKNSSYDINDYGAQILDSLSEDNSIPFSKIVEGKSTRDIARFFQSTLQLASMGNVELENTSPGEVASNLELRLLVRDQPFEKLDEYEAPSEIVNKERFRQWESNEQSSTAQRPGPSSLPSVVQHKSQKRKKLRK